MNLYQTFKRFIVVLFTISITVTAQAQKEVIEPIPYGNMNHWIKRYVKESFIIGGATKTLYEIGDSRETVGTNQPYFNKYSPWATSSVYALVKGISKGSVTVFPVKRGDGFAALLETKVVKVKVLGLIKIYAQATGTIFLGHMVEPITSTDNPQHNLVSGIPFHKKPSYLQFDYKVITGGPSSEINGLHEKGTPLGTTDKAEIQVLLQKRWEDANGNVHALRIGTGWVRLGKTQTTWQNNYRVPIHYGNITGKSFYRNYMGLRQGKEAYYTRNSKGKMVPILEEGWGKPTDSVTDIILQFASSDGGAFKGNNKSKLWIDNVSLVYEKKN